MNSGKGARARGVDGMIQMDHGTSRRAAGDEAPSNAGGLSDDAPRTAGRSSMEADGTRTTWKTSSMASGGEGKGYGGVEVEVMVRVTPQQCMERAGQEPMRREERMPKVEQPTFGSSGSGEFRAEVQEPVRPNLAQQRGGACELLVAPWDLEKYQRPIMGSTDQWEMALVPQGWLVRVHKKERKRLFHPIHGSLPIHEGRIEHTRCTVRYFGNGTKDAEIDDWRGNTRTRDGEKWRGFTFIKVKPFDSVEGDTNYAPAGASSMDPRESDSNGSYEFIGEGLESRP